MKKIFAISIFMLFVFGVNGQDVRHTGLNWQVNRLNDLLTNSETDYTCVFKTNGSTTIEWQQKGRTSKLKVLSVNGEWTNVKANGKITYAIDLEGSQGTLTVERTAAGCSVTLDFAPGTDDHFKHQYKVAKVTSASKRRTP